MTLRNARIGLGVVLALVLVAGAVTLVRSVGGIGRTHVIGYFDNSKGLFVGDEVRVLGVPVGKIDRIEPQPTRVKISFWYDSTYRVPADAKAVILSPSLVTARAIQLTPAYTGGPAMQNDAVIPQQRTAVPVEFDDIRQQLQKLTEMLQPTQPGGVSTLGSWINSAADNLRGQGTNIRDTMLKLSQAVSALGDHSQDIFGTVKSLSILVSALQQSTDLMVQLNQNLATVTGLLADDPTKINDALRDVHAVIDDVRNFIADNKETLGTTSDKLASLSTALNESIDDIKQSLHVAPTAFSNLVNAYHPAQGSLVGALTLNTFANPITFICGAIQAASRLNAQQSSKLCVQYLAPILKNRQYNFLPIGENLFVGPQARPNEVTYSEDWLRPDYVPPAPPGVPMAESPAPPPAEAVPTNPADGLRGIMVPQGGS
ncbi:MCE family protein [Mycobacterium sp. E1747]|uniref:MCE family protein n=1 Tax=Mycobacterium sp. E1747 TaxID=1834128 RepID=UPI0007FFDB3D|nr:MCE family protein [Mycobacterium sp. E1747]OBH08204.1 mammalian cell entry protein [Mycobacterium sp. E1747]